MNWRGENRIDQWIDDIKQDTLNTQARKEMGFTSPLESIYFTSQRRLLALKREMDKTRR